MIVRLSLFAEADLEEAADYYEAAREGLGRQFVADFYRARQRIAEHPRAWAKYHRRTGVCKLDRFPFGIVYLLRRTEAYAVGVIDLRRKPDYWAWRMRLT